ncbi:hypothetical protein F3Y22_tig00111850pilonHSYRG00014 [Hibiscus syriacus]|uniref:Uncharacterized protein n=1 Tax=Hibiscus syriacus TaxID=106335 RepID=A0A6A2XQM0_HIBSY|nr:hypothetical protein F3Y22_tig00111850pilonHSYRG00014 [Hibiscus syriacus]
MSMISELKLTIMVVPKKKTYHVKPINFSGPCKSPLVLKSKAEAPSMAMVEHGGKSPAKTKKPSLARKPQLLERSMNALT